MRANRLSETPSISGNFSDTTVKRVGLHDILQAAESVTSSILVSKEQHNITGSTSPKSNTTLQAVPAQRATQHYKPNGMSTNCGNISQPHPLFHTNCSSTYHCFLRRFPSSLHHRLSLLLFFLLHFIHPIRYMAILVFRSEQVSRKSWYNVPNYTAS